MVRTLTFNQNNYSSSLVLHLSSNDDINELLSSISDNFLIVNKKSLCTKIELFSDGFAIDLNISELILFITLYDLMPRISNCNSPIQTIVGGLYNKRIPELFLQYKYYFDFYNSLVGLFNNLNTDISYPWITEDADFIKLNDSSIWISLKSNYRDILTALKFLNWKLKEVSKILNLFLFNMITCIEKVLNIMHINMDVFSEKELISFSTYKNKVNTTKNYLILTQEEETTIFSLYKDNNVANLSKEISITTSPSKRYPKGLTKKAYKFSYKDIIIYLINTLKKKNHTTIRIDSKQRIQLLSYLREIAAFFSLKKEMTLLLDILIKQDASNDIKPFNEQEFQIITDYEYIFYTKDILNEQPHVLSEIEFHNKVTYEQNKAKCMVGQMHFKDLEPYEPLISNRTFKKLIFILEDNSKKLKKIFIYTMFTDYIKILNIFTSKLAHVKALRINTQQESQKELEVKDSPTQAEVNFIKIQNKSKSILLSIATIDVNILEVEKILKALNRLLIIYQNDPLDRKDDIDQLSIKIQTKEQLLKELNKARGTLFAKMHQFTLNL